MEAWIKGYIGIPYLEHGRDAKGCDCWGLVRLVLAEQFGKTVPSFGDRYDEVDAQSTANLIDLETPTVNGTRIETPEPGSVVVIRVLGVPSHVGIVCGPCHFLHITRGMSAVVERLDAPKIAPRIEGVYRVL